MYRIYVVLGYSIKDAVSFFFTRMSIQLSVDKNSIQKKEIVLEF